MKNYLLTFVIIIITNSVIYSQSADFSTDAVCLGEHSTFNALSSYPDSLIKYWNWDFDEDALYDDATGKLVTHLFSQSGSHNISVMVELNDGQKFYSSYKPSVVNPIPDVNFHVDNLCEGKQATYTDASTISSGSVVSYYWDFNNDGVNDNVSGGPQVSYTCGPAQVYVTRLSVISDMGCSAFTTKTTEVYPQPEAWFSYVGSCAKNETSFEDLSEYNSGNASYRSWDFGDGEMGAGNIFSHAYDQPGSYTCKLVVVTAEQCKDSISQSININPSPSVSIIADKNSIYNGQQATLSVLQTYQEVTWSNGEQGNSTIVSAGGVYSVKVSDNNNCSALDSLQISEIATDSPVFESEVLTPNNDGINDKFTILNLFSFEKVTLNIYNIYGDPVYSSDNYDNNWDGVSNENTLPSGAYYYILNAGNTEYTGVINILR